MRGPRLVLSTVTLLFSAALLSCGTSDAERASPLAPTPDAAVAAGVSYTRVTEVLPLTVPTLDVSQVIGVDGGSLSLLGHRIDVPAGAVTVPTLFTMSVLPNGMVEVELSATLKGLLGSLIDIGGSGFRKPVMLSLTYARATNVTDPSRLRIMRLNSNGKHEILPSTVETGPLIVKAQLDHFSRYCMISD